MKNLCNLFEGIFDIDDSFDKTIEYIPHLEVAPLGRIQIQKLFNEYASAINDVIYLSGAARVVNDVQEALDALASSIDKYNNQYHPGELGDRFSRATSIDLQQKVEFMLKNILDSQKIFDANSAIMKNLDWYRSRYDVIYNLMIDLHKKYPRDINVWMSFHMSQKPKPKITVVFEVNEKANPSKIDELWKFVKSYKFLTPPTIKETGELKSLIWK